MAKCMLSVACHLKSGSVTLCNEHAYVCFKQRPFEMVADGTCMYSKGTN